MIEVLRIIYDLSACFLMILAGYYDRLFALWNGKDVKNG